MAMILMLLLNDDWGRMWEETYVVSLKVTSWDLKGLNTTKDLWISDFPAKNPTQDSPETGQ
jgi:hypothetical protein